MQRTAGRSARWREIVPPGLHRPDQAPAADGDGWTGCGSGFAAYRDALAGRHGSRLVAVRTDVSPTARAVLRLARGGSPPATAPMRRARCRCTCVTRWR